MSNNLLENISKCAIDSVKEKLNLQVVDIPLVKRNKSLKNGDFQIPLVALKKLVTAASGSNGSQDKVGHFAY